MTNETVLFAVTGMSPAVLTETIWSLAHEKPPTIPDRVVVITTSIGKNRIEAELFTPTPEYGGLTVWQALRKQILGPNFENDPRINMEDIRVIANCDPKTGRSYPLPDIRTPADNETAADFILEELRRLTENPDIRVVASLAGGRKTMSALLYAAMSLLGRANDRLTHVLVSEPFDNPSLTPKFYFPTPDGALETLHQLPSTGATYSSSDAQLWLADVPYVHLRDLFPKHLGRYPGKFYNLIRAYSRRIQEIMTPPTITLDHQHFILKVNNTPIPLNAREFAIYQFLADRCRSGQAPFCKYSVGTTEFSNWLPNWITQLEKLSRHYESLSKWKDITEEEIRKHLSGIRKKLIKAGLSHLESFLLPQRGNFGINVRVKNPQ